MRPWFGMASPGERAAVMGALVVLTIAAMVSSYRNVTLVKLIDIPYQNPSKPPQHGPLDHRKRGASRSCVRDV